MVAFWKKIHFNYLLYKYIIDVYIDFISSYLI